MVWGVEGRYTGLPLLDNSSGCRIIALVDGLPSARPSDARMEPTCLSDPDVKRLLLFFPCLVFLVSAVSADDPTSDVPLSHRIYQTVDRFEARGWFDEPVSGVRPYTRRQAARFLLRILRRADSGASLSQTERGVLDRHRAEFGVELARLGYASASSSPKRGMVGRLFGGDNLFAWQDSVATVAIDPLFRQRLLLVRGGGRTAETVSQTYVGGIVRGTFHNRLGFRIRHFEAREWSTRMRTSRGDVVARPIEDVQLKGKTVDFREAAFQLIWAAPWFNLDIGKGSLDWGPGRTGNLFLTDYAPPFGLVRLRASYGRVVFTHVVGLLRARAGLIDSTRTRIDNGHVRTFLRSKHLAAHRVEIALSGRVSLGLQEAVVYGDRRPEFLYLPPATVLTAAQTYIGDRDNLMVGLDLSARPARNLRAYFALFFDDLKKFSPGAFSNKFAFQVGFLWVDPFGLPDTDLQMEYIRLEPFVYSHHFDINTHEHFDALLGYPSGPNADRIFGSVTHRFSPALSLRVALDRERQGENILNPDGSLVNVGGDAEQGQRPLDPLTKRFMDGIRETRTRLGVGIAYEPLRDLLFTLQYQATAAGNVLLPGGNRGNGRIHIWTMTADFNFF